MNHTTIAIVIIIAVTALLITASSVSQSDAFAKKKSHRYSHYKSQYARFFQGASSGIGQRNDQSSVCISGFAIGGSCNNIGANVNTGNTVGANVGDNSGSSGNGHGHGSQRARSNIDQSNDQTAVCISGTGIGDSCNNIAANANTGNAVGANVGNSGGSHSSQGVNSGINQHNKQTSVCISPGSVSLSCTNAAANINTGNPVGANVFP